MTPNFGRMVLQKLKKNNEDPNFGSSGRSKRKISKEDHVF